MSGWSKCTCEGTRKERMKNWFVLEDHRNGNYSHFESPKGCFHGSDYSTVMCRKCNMHIRSKALFVFSLPDGKPEGW